MHKKKMIEGIACGTIDRDEDLSMYRNIIAEELKTVIKSLNIMNTKIRRKMVNIFEHLKEIFVEPKADYDADDEADDKKMMKNQILQMCMI